MQQFYLCFFGGVKSNYGNFDYNGLFYLSIKIITAVFYRSLEVVHIFWREKCKIIIFGLKIFLKEFSHHMSSYMLSA